VWFGEKSLSCWWKLGNCRPTLPLAIAMLPSEMDLDVYLLPVEESI